MLHVLMIDDEPEQLASHVLFLREKQCSVEITASISQALSLLKKKRFDLILSDAKMPHINGPKGCEAIRSLTDAPVIFLSNYTDDSDQLQGFSAGGTDYISKECGLELFWARLKSRLNQKNSLLTFRNYPPLLLDLQRQKVTLNQNTVLLTPTEFSLLALLSSKPGKIWTTDQIYHELWGPDGPVNVTMVQMHLSRMRRKMEEAFPQHEFVTTVWGKGYQFVLMDDPMEK